MKIACYGLTNDGSHLAYQLSRCLQADAFIKRTDQLNNQIEPIRDPLKDLVKEHFDHYDALIFVMATGIVVRTIAPLIQSKQTDPAVIVLDERGQYAISLLSGHIGGANELALKIAEITGGQAVITTATDVNNTLAFDVYATKNDFAIMNIDQLKYISQAMIDKKLVGLYSDVEVNSHFPQNVIRVNDYDDLSKFSDAVVISQRDFDWNQTKRHQLQLIPKCIIVGIGCKRGTSPAQIDQAITSCLAEARLNAQSICQFASADVKSDEQGLLEYCRNNNYPITFYSCDQLNEVVDGFKQSEFVKSQIGVGAVAEPSGYLASSRGNMLLGRRAYNGVTIALFIKSYRLD